VDASEVLRQVRRRAGLSQRELHRLTGVAQPTIARIESGLTVPRIDTFSRLLEACGETLLSAPANDAAIDREVVRHLLRALPPARRVELLLEEAETSSADAARPWTKVSPS
jgi:predicted transcriptional regulator